MVEKNFSKWLPFSDDVIKKWQTVIFYDKYDQFSN